MRYFAFALLSLPRPLAAFHSVLQEDPLPQARQQQDLGALELRAGHVEHRRRTPPPPPRVYSVRRRRATRHNIPLQLVITAKEGSVDELPPQLRDNVRQTLALNRDLSVRFLDDKACHTFIAANFADLEAPFASEKFGPFRGDICRAAVLALEGGFYADLDLQFRHNFSDLVDNTTTFMSAWSGVDCDIMNALLAVERGSAVMQSVLEAMKNWYTAGENNGKLMGTQTMMRGLDNLVARDCPEVNIRRRDQLNIDCGLHQQFRLYMESRLYCPRESSLRNDVVASECPMGRTLGPELLKWGIFEPPVSHSTLVAWTRYEKCSSLGCGEKQARRLERATSWCNGRHDVS